MSTGGFPPPAPLDDDAADEPVVEDDGEELLDEDAADERIDSAEADRIAAEDGSA